MAVAPFFDRILETSTTTGTGTLTLAGAVTGYQTFGAAGNGNLTPMAVWEVDANGNPSGAWETAKFCVYTTSGTTLTRGVFLASSTGSVINFAAGTKRVAQVLPASLINQLNWIYDAAAADAAPAMVVNTFYSCNISGYTADRTATLPATSAIGDRIGIYIITGDSLYELLLTATSGDTLNGVAGGTEWSRLFITNELVVLRCTETDAAWIVETDGRIPMVAKLQLSTAATTNAANTYVFATDNSGVWTATQDNGSLTTVATDRITFRRAAKVGITLGGRTSAAIADANYVNFGYSLNAGTSPVWNQFYVAGVGSLSAQIGGATTDSFVAGDYIRYIFRPQELNKGLAATAQSYVSILEILQP